MSDRTPSVERGQPEHAFPIHIDNATFRVASPTLTGSELRELPTPAIGPEFDLWEDVPGGNDRLIGPEDVVQLRNGMHFFTAPAQINPGVA